MYLTTISLAKQEYLNIKTIYNNTIGIIICNTMYSTQFCYTSFTISAI